MFARDTLARETFEEGIHLPVVRVAPATDRTTPEDFWSLDPEIFFPRALLVKWLARCGVAAAGDHSAVLSFLAHARSELFLSYRMEVAISELRLQGHAKVGAASATRRALREVAVGAGKAALALGHLRGEIRYRKLRDARSTDLEELHVQLHETFRSAQDRRGLHSMHPASSDYSPSLETEIGLNSALASTWLEDALVALALDALALADKSSAKQLPSLSPVAMAARDQFIRNSARAWEVCSGSQWTVMDAGSRAPREMAPFERFHHQLCGHVAALLVGALRLRWEEADETQRQRAKDVASRIGLAPVPSASTIRKILGRRGNPHVEGTDRSVT